MNQLTTDEILYLVALISKESGNILNSLEADSINQQQERLKSIMEKLFNMYCQIKKE